MQISISLPADPLARGQLLTELAALAHNMVIRDGAEIDLEIDGQIDHVLEKWRNLNLVVAATSLNGDTDAPRVGLAPD